MEKEVNHQWFFTHPTEKVWDYLTKSDLMEQWLMKNDFLPIVGYDFQFRIPPVPKLNFDGIVYCKVLEIIPLKKLIYSWKSGPGQGKIELDSLVEWTLTPKENGTELRLKHSGFKESDFNMYSAVKDGWDENVQKIMKLLNSKIHDTPNT